jgi:hypothetical protein
MKMKKIHLTNDSENSISLIVEPIADVYDINGGNSVMLVFEDDNEMLTEVIWNNDNVISIWTHGLTKVYNGENLLSPS